LCLDLGGRSDPQNVANPHEAKPPGKQDDVERLVPRNIHQANGHLAVHVVARDHVELRHFSDEAQDICDVDILEVERNPPTLVYLFSGQTTRFKNIDRRFGLERRRNGFWILARFGPLRIIDIGRARNGCGNAVRFRLCAHRLILGHRRWRSRHVSRMREIDDQE